jgi:hypothetical protein
MGVAAGVVAMPTRETVQSAFIKANFQVVWPVHLSGFTRLLVQLRRRFNGDLDLALVLAVIGSRTQVDRWTPDLVELSQMTTGEDTGGTQLPINIHSVAEYSGIPRETVRRKVAILQDRGWVVRGADGRLAVTRDAASELKEGTADTIAYLASVLMAFQAAQAIGTNKETGSPKSMAASPEAPEQERKF